MEKDSRNAIGWYQADRAQGIVYQPGLLVVDPAPDDADGDDHQRIRHEYDRAIDVPAADTRVHQNREADRQDDAGDGRQHEVERVAQRFPEHVVVEEHFLVVVQTGEARRLRERPMLEGKDDVPAQRDEPVEQEDYQRRSEQDEQEQRPPAPERPPAPCPSRAAGGPSGGSALRRNRHLRAPCRFRHRTARSGRGSARASCALPAEPPARAAPGQSPPRPRERRRAACPNQEARRRPP